MSYDEKTGVLMAGLVLKGMVFLRQKADGTWEKDHHEDWPTMHAVSVGGGRALLLDRFGVMRLVGPRQGAGFAYAETANWPIEGIPTHGVYSEGRLIIAAGAAGVLLYDWPDPDKEPALRGRFPYVDYTKEITLGGSGVIWVADNLDTGMQVLEVSDLQHPKLLAMRKAGFVETTAWHDDVAVLGSRMDGLVFFDGRDAANPMVLQTMVLPVVGERRQQGLSSVTFDKEGRLLVSAGSAGLWLCVRESNEPVKYKVATDALAEGKPVLDAIFLPGNRFAMSTLESRIVIGDLPK